MIYGIRYAPESLFRLRWEPPNRFPRGTGFVPVALSGKALFRDTFTRKGDKGLHWKGELKLHGMKTWTVIGIDDCSKT